MSEHNEHCAHTRLLRRLRERVTERLWRNCWRRTFTLRARSTTGLIEQPISVAAGRTAGPSRVSSSSISCPTAIECSSHMLAAQLTDTDPGNTEIVTLRGRQIVEVEVLFRLVNPARGSPPAAFSIKPK